MIFSSSTDKAKALGFQKEKGEKNMHRTVIKMIGFA
jgi:hypothetical protein